MNFYPDAQRLAPVYTPINMNPAPSVIVPQGTPAPKEEEKHNSFMLYERSVFIFSVFSIALFAAWVLWAPFVHLLIPNLDSSRNHITTISDTFAMYNSLSTIYLSIPVTIFFLLRTFRVFKNNLLQGYEKKVLFILLIMAQIFLFVVTRYDVINNDWHYVCTALTLIILYYYHFQVQDALTFHWINVNTVSKDLAWVTNVKVPILFLSIVLVLVFAAIIVPDRDMTQSSFLWAVACICEVGGIVTLGCLDFVDIYALGQSIDNERSLSQQQKKVLFFSQ